MSERINCRYRRCGNEADVSGSRFCGEHDQDWIREMYQRFDDLCAEGYTRYQASLMAGLSDPGE